MISKQEFVKKVHRLGHEITYAFNNPNDIDETEWEMANVVLPNLNASVPGIGILSGPKRIRCFLTVCSVIDTMIKKEQLTSTSAFLAMVLLAVTNSRFETALDQFVHWAPRMSWQEAVEFPDFALNFFKQIRGS